MSTEDDDSALSRDSLTVGVSAAEVGKPGVGSVGWACAGMYICATVCLGNLIAVMVIDR